MKVIIECTPKEIAALVLELQERQICASGEQVELSDLGIKLCADKILEHK